MCERITSRALEMFMAAICCGNITHTQHVVPERHLFGAVRGCRERAGGTFVVALRKAILNTSAPLLRRKPLGLVHDGYNFGDSERARKQYSLDLRAGREQRMERSG